MDATTPQANPDTAGFGALDAAPAGTLAQRLLDLTGRDPDALAIEHVAGGAVVRLSRAGLLARATDFAAAFGRVAGPTGVVPIILRHDADLVPAFVGSMLAGRRPCVLAWPTPRLDPDRWAAATGRLLAAAGAEAIITRGELRGVLHAVAPAGVRVIDADDVEPASGSGAAGTAAATPEDLAFLQFSSGTTGLPKGLGLSNRAVLAQVGSYSEAIGLGPDDRIISWLPLYHDMGLVAATLLPLLTGTPVTMLDPIEWVSRPAMLLEHIERTRATLTWQPNFAFDFLARAVPPAVRPDLSSLRAWISCSEPVRAGSFDAFRDRFAACGVTADRLLTCYAMAENTFAVTQSAPGDIARRLRVDRERLEREGVAEPLVPSRPPTSAESAESADSADAAGSTSDAAPETVALVSCGRPIAGVELTIAAPAGAAALPDGHVGRILVASPSQFPGYWPETSRTGPYDTGDLGFRWDGELYVTGRSKDLIIVRGRNIQPHDLEAATLEIAGVRPGRVVALGRPAAGGSTESVLVLAEPMRPQDAAADRALASTIRTHLQRTCDLPEVDVAIVPPRWLVKTSSGKIARGANLDRWLATVEDEPARTPTAAAAPARTPSGSDQVDADADAGTDALLIALDDWLAVRGGTGPADAERPLRARVDSLGLVELFAWLEARTGRTIDSAARETLAAASAAEVAARLTEVPGRRTPDRPDVRRPPVEILVGGDGSLAESALTGWAETAADLERLGVSPARRIVFRRRIDALVADLDRTAAGTRPAAWSPDLEAFRTADVVVIDLFAEMLAAPEVRLRRSGDPDGSRGDLTAIRWLPLDDLAVAGDLVIEPARRLRPSDIVAELDRLAAHIGGRLVVITHGERNAATFPWSGWIAETNAALRASAPRAAWTLADAGGAMDRIEPGHLRAPWVPLPDPHRDELRRLVQATVEAELGPRDRAPGPTTTLAGASDPASVAGGRGPVPGFGGRHRAAHSCVADITSDRLDLWARLYRRVLVVGEPFSAPGLEAELADRGLAAARIARIAEATAAPVGAEPEHDAAIVVSGRHRHAALAALSERLGGVPIESALTQEPPDPIARLWRTAARESWRRLHAAGRPIALVGHGRLARLHARTVADLPAPPVAWRGDASDLDGLPLELSGPNEALGAVVLLAERDKELQARLLARLGPGIELIVPAAWSGELVAPASPVFAPDPAETFLRPDPTAPDWPSDGRWSA